MGLKFGREAFNYPIQLLTASRRPTTPGFKSTTCDGSPAGLLLGHFQDYSESSLSINLRVLSYLQITDDYVTIFQFIPKSPAITDIKISWLVHEDAIEGKDYNIEHLIGLWDITTKQDVEIIDNNQKGVNSTRYTPGPYSKSELDASHFVAWYLYRLSQRDDYELPILYLN